MIRKVYAVYLICPADCIMRELCGIFVSINIVYLAGLFEPSEIMKRGRDIGGEILYYGVGTGIAVGYRFAVWLGVEVSEDKERKRKPFEIIGNARKHSLYAEYSCFFADVVEVQIIKTEKFSVCKAPDRYALAYPRTFTLLCKAASGQIRGVGKPEKIKGLQAKGIPSNGGRKTLAAEILISLIEKQSVFGKMGDKIGDIFVRCLLKADDIGSFTVYLREDNPDAVYKGIYALILKYTAQIKAYDLHCSTLFYFLKV